MDPLRGLVGIEEAMQYYKESVANPETPLTTGFKDIDEIYPTMNKGDLIVIGGLPSVGKTSFALDVLLNITVNQGVPAVFLTLEEGLNTLAAKIVKKYSPDGTGIADIPEEVLHAPLTIDDTAGVEVNKLEEKIIDHINQCDARVVCIDYLQLLLDYPRQVTQELKYNNISTTLKTIARTLGVTLIVITKLSGSAYRNCPILEAVHLSGTVEYEADLIMVLEKLEREEDVIEDPDKDLYILNVAKNRHGATKEIGLEFDKRRWLFRLSESPVDEDIVKSIVDRLKSEYMESKKLDKDVDSAVGDNDEQ